MPHTGLVELLGPRQAPRRLVGGAYPKLFLVDIFLQTLLGLIEVTLGHVCLGPVEGGLPNVERITKTTSDCHSKALMPALKEPQKIAFLLRHTHSTKAGRVMEVAGLSGARPLLLGILELFGGPK
jgi:hypothetical protein